MQNYVLYNACLLLPALAPRRVVPRLDERSALLSDSEHCLSALLNTRKRTHVPSHRPPCRSGTTRLFPRRAPSTPPRTRGAQPNPAEEGVGARTRRVACRAKNRRCPTCSSAEATITSSLRLGNAPGKGMHHTPAETLTCLQSWRRIDTTIRRRRRGKTASRRVPTRSARRALADHRPEERRMS